MSPAMSSYQRPFTGVHGEYAEIFRGPSGGLSPVRLLVHRSFDTAPGGVFLADDALGVDPQQYGDAVPGPLRYLGCGHAGVEPRRHGGVP